MGNTNTALFPKILARVLKETRPNLAMIPLVNSDFSLELASKGQTIDVPLSVPMTATDVAPGNNPGPDPTDITPTTTPVKLDKHKHVAFGLTDKEMAEIDANKNFIPSQAREAMIGLFTQMNADLWATYVNVYNIAGAAGTNPFATDMAQVNAVHRVMSQAKCSVNNRQMLIDFAAEEKAKNLAAMQDASKKGDTNVILEGFIGKALGFNFFSDHQVPTHTSAAMTAGAATANGVNVINAGSTDNGRTGTISINKITNATNLIVGDVLSIANDPQTYVVTAAVTLAVGNTTVAIRPALTKATAGGEAITKTNTHTVNLAFTPPAFALAVRPMSDLSTFKGGNEIVQMQDPISKMIARMEVSRQNKRVVWDFDVLYGVACPRPEFAARLLG